MMVEAKGEQAVGVCGVGEIERGGCIWVEDLERERKMGE